MRNPLAAAYADLHVVRLNETTKWARGNHDMDKKIVHVTRNNDSITVTRIKK